MTRYQHLFILLLLAFGLSSSAAEPVFIVFYNSGKASKIENGKTVILKKGDHLATADAVTLPEKTQLVLVCTNYAVVQLKAPGKFTVKSLLTKCNSVSASASSAYFKYVWSQFSHAHTTPDADPHHYMKTYGAASRGKTILTTVNTDTIYYHDGQLRVGWPAAKALMVQVYATNANEKLILKGTLAYKANLDSIASILRKPGSYYWDFAGEERDKFRVLQLLDKSKYDQLKKSILSSVIVTTPAETAYLSGYLLEEKHFLAEAAKYYEKAAQLDQTNPIYQNAANRFK